MLRFLFFCFVLMCHPAPLRLPLSEEQLYSEMRVYGTLKAMEMDPKQEFATFTFRSLSSAISARLCLHMKEIEVPAGGSSGGAVTKQHIRVNYQHYSRWEWVNKMFSNPRFTVPVLAIGGTLLSYLLIDPIRLFNVTRTLMNRTKSLHADQVPESEDILALDELLSQRPSGAGILLLGSDESRGLVLEKISSNRWFVVSVDLTPEGINKVRDTVQDLSNQIGFYPSFNALSKLFEYFQAMIPGTKASTIGGNVEEQLQAVLKVLTQALKIVSRTYPRDGSAFPYALVILDFKSTLSERGNAAVVPLMQEWALEMMERKIAHVVVTADSRFSVTSDGTFGALKNHAYITHRVPDMSLDAVRGMVQPIFDKNEELVKSAKTPLRPALVDDESEIGALEVGTPATLSSPTPADLPTLPEKEEQKKRGGILNLWGMMGRDDTVPLPEEEEAEATTAPQQPPPEPIQEHTEAGRRDDEAPAAGWVETASKLLEKVLLKEGRSVLERYTGQAKPPQPVPLDSLTPDSLAQMIHNILGGRLSDILKLLNRVESTRRSPLTVLRLMEAEAMASILNAGFGKKLYGGATPGSWTQPQLWKCIKLIATAESQGWTVPISSVLLTVFKGDQNALQELLKTGILRIDEVYAHGQPRLTAGSPLFLFAFKLMLQDSQMRKGMEQMALDQEYKDWNEEAMKLEDDLKKLSGRGLYSDMDANARAATARRKAQLASRLGDLATLIDENRAKKKAL